MKTKEARSVETTRISRIAFSFLFCLLAISVPVYAQVFTGSISGTVTDSSGAAMPAANLTLRQAGTGLVISTSSDATGNFSFPSADPGDYTLTIAKDGFKTLEKTGIVLQTGERVALGAIALTVGEVTQTVTVTAEAATVDTQTAAHAAYLTSSQVETQLMLGRNTASLVQLSPGISVANVDATLDRSGSGFSSQGQPTNTNRFSVDGINSTDSDNGTDIKLQQSADAIAEVTVLQNNYQAEYANAAGAMVLETTKSGTSTFHGGANYYMKNEAFEANTYFNKLNGLPRAKDRIFNFNYLIGGPVAFRNFNRNRDKLFFFWNQEFWPTKGTRPFSVTVPTDLERAGDFSQSYQPGTTTLRIIDDPNTGQPFTGNKIPSNRFDANGSAILSLFPHANFFNTAVSKGQYNYIGQGAYQLPDRTSTLRIDYNASNRDRFSFTWATFYEDAQGFGGTALAFNGSQWPYINAKFTANNNGLAARWTHTISASTVNEAAVSWQTNPEQANATNPAAPLQKTYGLSLPALSPKGNPDGYVPSFTFGGVPNGAGIPNTGYNWLPYKAPNNVWNWTDKLSSLHGAHSLKLGIEITHFWRDFPGTDSRFGAYTFTSSSLNPLDTNYDYSNTILGIFQNYQETNGIPRQKARGGEDDIFIQDTWKVLPRLSLDYGVRLEYILPTTQADNEWAAFYPAAYNPSGAVTLFQPGKNSSQQRVAVDPITGAQYSQAAIGAIVPGTGVPFNGMVSPALGTSPTKGLFDNRGVQVVPRFGFSWDVFGDGKTAVRGGAGVFTSPYVLSTWRGFVSQPPLFLTPQVFYSTISSLQSAPSFIFPQNVSGDNYNDKTPVSYNFNLGIEREIGSSTIVDVGYVGAVDRHLRVSQNLNAIPFGTDFLASSQDPTNGKVLTQNLLEPIPGYGSISVAEYSGTSNYNSLQASVNRRAGKWLTFGVNYTWSKAMGYASTLSTLIPNRFENYSELGTDQTHALKVNWLWNLPPSPWDNARARAALSGWQLSGSLFAVSGTPVTPSFSTTVPVDITGSPTDGARLDMSSNPNLAKSSRTFSHAFNTSVFSLPAVGTYGTMRSNPLRGPGQQTWNLALLKSFNITERLHLEFRMETYNTFNHANFSSFNTGARFNTSGTPATNPNWGQQTNPAFGQYTATLAPRVMQLGARLSF